MNAAADERSGRALSGVENNAVGAENTSSTGAFGGGGASITGFTSFSTTEALLFRIEPYTSHMSSHRACMRLLWFSRLS